jgi:AraC-like DNA-binding protein
MKKPAIEIHWDELDGVGVEIVPVESLQCETYPAHRDDHYIFIVQREGYCLWELDFSQVALTGPMVCYIAPGQVHQNLDFKGADGWLVFVTPGLVSPENREIFDHYAHVRQAASIAPDSPLFQLVPILGTTLEQAALALRAELASALTGSVVTLLASYILQSEYSEGLVESRKYRTAARFKQLVAENHKGLKQVKEYAALLNITPLYLNEIVKEVTGFSASYRINQEILLEAKRMLAYTRLDVKQIAYELGYEDHAYFSRFFKKHVGTTPVAFRNSKPLFVQS